MRIKHAALFSAIGLAVLGSACDASADIVELGMFGRDGHLWGVCHA